MGIFIKNNCDCCPPSVCEPCDPCAATQGTGTLYFNPVTYGWDYVGNWWQDAAATIPALAVPWVPNFITGCTPYYHYNLTGTTSNTGNVGPYNVHNIIMGDGICDLYQVVNESIIYSGTFTGDRFGNSGDGINGGTFTGDDFVNEGYIDGGTFSGNGFVNSGGITFDGINFYYQGHISGGTWAGSGFTNHPYYSDYDGYVCAPSWPVQTC